MSQHRPTERWPVLRRTGRSKRTARDAPSLPLSGSGLVRSPHHLPQADCPSASTTPQPHVLHRVARVTAAPDRAQRQLTLDVVPLLRQHSTMTREDALGGRGRPCVRASVHNRPLHPRRLPGLRHDTRDDAMRSPADSPGLGRSRLPRNVVTHPPRWFWRTTPGLSLPQEDPSPCVPLARGSSLRRPGGTPRGRPGRSALEQYDPDDQHPGAPGPPPKPRSHAPSRHPGEI